MRYKVEIFEYEERKKTLLCDDLNEVEKMKKQYHLAFYEPYYLVREIEGD